MTKKTSEILANIFKYPPYIIITINYVCTILGIKFLSDKSYLKALFKYKLGYDLNLMNPNTYNEKLQWLKLYNRKAEYTVMVDKYNVRDYIVSKIGDEYLIPILGKWEHFDDIDFDKLPNKFVLKCTHGSGSIAICKNKKEFDFKLARKKINIWMKRNFYFYAREWPYKNVVPNVIAEEYLEAKDGQLLDYQLHVFNGLTKLIYVIIDRFKSRKKNIYNIHWELQKFQHSRPYDEKIKLETPKNLDKMIEIAEILAANIPYLRVDFYDIDGKLYIGELTFFPSGGFGKLIPFEYDELLGSWISLPNFSRTK